MNILKTMQRSPASRPLAAGVLLVGFGSVAAASSLNFGTDPIEGTSVSNTPGRQVIGGEFFISFNTPTEAFVFNGPANSIPDNANLIVRRNTDNDDNPLTPVGAGNAADILASRLTVPGPGLFIYFNSSLNRHGGASEQNTGDETDRALVERALEGNRDALRQLVERHQAFVFNVALKMFGQREDAEDLTQEVFVKVITSLKTFRNEGALRTWLYRLTVNHFLKTRRRALEISINGFEDYFESIAAVPDEDDPAAHGVNDQTVEELRLRCTSGMLMCLDGPQRMTFILGAMFGLSHQEGAAALGTTPGNFRVRLHRARGDLYRWMNEQCGLVNQANPCRCRKKTAGFVKLGLVDPERLVLNADYAGRIDELTRRDAAATMQAVEDLNELVFRSHPLQRGGGAVLDAILGDKAINSFFRLA